jgi:drug/metabolite transporter (DMT)-like permease
MLSHVIFVLVCLIWGSSFILMKLASPAFGACTIACGRVLCGAAALALVWTARRRSWRFERRHLAPLAVVATLGYAIPFTVQPIVINQSSSAFMGLMVGLVPLVTILVSVPMLGVMPTARQVVGVLGGLAFLAYLMVETRQKLHVPALHLLLALSVPVTYAISNITIKRFLAGVPAMQFTAAALALAGAGLVAPATLEPVKTGPGLPTALAAMAALGLLSTGLAYYIFYKLIEWHGPLYAGMVTYLVPPVALACGWLAGEKITAGQLAALGGILVMVGLVQLRASPAAKAGQALEEPPV